MTPHFRRITFNSGTSWIYYSNHLWWTWVLDSKAGLREIALPACPAIPGQAGKAITYKEATMSNQIATITKTRKRETAWIEARETAITWCFRPGGEENVSPIDSITLFLLLVEFACHAEL